MKVSTPGRIALTVVSIILTLMIIISYMYSSGYFVDLDGSIGVIDHAELWDEIDPISRAIYSISDYLCHQQMSRSFIINGSEIALCIRDFSVLVGIEIGLILTDDGLKIIKTYNTKLLLISLALSLATLFECLVIKINFVDSSIMRTSFSIISGIGVAIIIQHFVRYEFKFLNNKL